jgi:RNA polymerase sigma factor (sigma-70 family)
LVQEALAATYSKWPTVSDGDPWAYARKCLVNANTSYWRRKPWRETTVAQVHEMPEAKSVTDDIDGRQLLRSLMNILTARERTVVVLRYLEELTERETAETMGIAVGTVKSTCARALTKLSTALALADEQV